MPRSGWDHPRVCGEKDHQARAAVGGAGSPPRMRGKAYTLFLRLPSAGITPAYAGKRVHHDTRTSKCRDHPRVCGEKLPIRWRQTSTPGSPPRMRGKVVELFQRPVHTRITPAYAGKSALSSIPLLPFWDHPRVCGEKSYWPDRLSQSPGSPPRMRGKDLLLCISTQQHRITPAYAGKSGRCCSTSKHLWDHPRVCGEKLLPIAPKICAPGSPPRMRGKGGLRECR